MNNCAIICEYNPFHSGHKYQLDVVRAHGASNIVCVMSGQFVQSATPAFCDKALRAECAIIGGADAVIELPAAYATASAQAFAEGAIKIIAAIKNADTLAMGATADAEVIKRISDIKIADKVEFKRVLTQNMKSGKSYNAAATAALSELFARKHPDKAYGVDDVLTEPNNILCIEYLTALATYAPHIEPLIIARRGALHGSAELDAEHISATAIRTASDDGRFQAVSKYLPCRADKISEFRKNHAPDTELYKNIAVFALKCKDLNAIARLRDCSEGMEYLLKSVAHLYSFDEYLSAAVGKRYGKKRVYRLFLDAVLGIEKGLTDCEFCTRLLACKKTFDFSIFPACVKTNNADIKAAASADAQVERVLAVDEKAVALYNTLCRIDGDYYNYSLVKI